MPTRAIPSPRPGRHLVLVTAMLLVAVGSLAATWSVGPGSEVVFVSRAPMETFEGQTDQVRGRVACDPQRLLAGCDLRLVVDLASLDTGIGLRNRHMRDRHLETDTYPEAVFTATEVLAASAPALMPGVPVEVTVRGELDLHGVVQPREIVATVTRTSGGGLEVVAGFPVKLSDHEIDRPGFLMMKLADEQEVRVELACQPEGS